MKAGSSPWRQIDVNNGVLWWIYTPPYWLSRVQTSPGNMLRSLTMPRDWLFVSVTAVFAIIDPRLIGRKVCGRISTNDRCRSLLVSHPAALDRTELCDGPPNYRQQRAALCNQGHRRSPVDTAVSFLVLLTFCCFRRNLHLYWRASWFFTVLSN